MQLPEQLLTLVREGECLCQSLHDAPTEEAGLCGCSCCMRGWLSHQLLPCDSLSVIVWISLHFCA